MDLKRFGTGLIFAAVLLTGCGGETATPTPTAEAGKQIAVNNPAGEMPSSITITSDTVEIAPGSSYEIKTPTPKFESSPVYGSVYVKKVIMKIPEGQIMPEIQFQGSLPTPCHKLIFRVDPINSQNQILIKALSAVDFKYVCSKSLQPFDQKIRLIDVPPGTYTVWFGGSNLGEFKVP